MKWHLGIYTLIAPLLFTLTSCEQKKENLSPEEKTESHQTIEDEEDVRTQAQLYIEAINNRDLEKIANFWSPEAVYRNPITGELVQGREGIRREINKMFDQLKDVKVEFRIDTIRFPVEGKASEEGITVLTIPGKEPIHSDYKMIHVKKDGKWLILHVSQLDFGTLNPKTKEKK